MSPSALKTPPPICLLCDTTLAPTPGPLHLLLFWARTHFPPPPGSAFPSPSESSQTLLREAPSVRATSQNMEASTNVGWGASATWCVLLPLRFVLPAHCPRSRHWMACGKEERGRDGLCGHFQGQSQTLVPRLHPTRESRTCSLALWPHSQLGYHDGRENKSWGGPRIATETPRDHPVSPSRLLSTLSTQVPASLSLITQHVCSCMRAHTRLLLIYLLSLSSCQKVSSTRAGIFCLFVRYYFPGFIRVPDTGWLLHKYLLN